MSNRCQQCAGAPPRRGYTPTGNATGWPVWVARVGNTIRDSHGGELGGGECMGVQAEAREKRVCGRKIGGHATASARTPRTPATGLARRHHGYACVDDVCGHLPAEHGVAGMTGAAVQGVGRCGAVVRKAVWLNV